jgi:acylphosphatase
MEQTARAHLIISGKVQGVFFRMETKRAADSHKVVGWVRNKADGTVEAVLEGDKSAVKQMIQWCHSGPPSAKVTDVSTTWQPYRGSYDIFDIRY